MSNLFLAFSGKHLKVSADDDARWAQCCPDVDRQQEYRFADDWLECNPHRRKKNVRRYMGLWLKYAQRAAAERLEQSRVGQGPQGVIKVRQAALDRFKARTEKEKR